MFLAEGSVWPYRYTRGTSPLVVSMPHVGTFVPHSIGCALAEAAVSRPDTDWHLARLYDFLAALDATVIRATHSRYVIDVNRPPDGANLYPGRETPGLCARETFEGTPLYRRAPPDEEGVRLRLDAVWRPYHRRIARELERVRGLHGVAVLWDAHSITSVAPRLFDGRLADFNLGTADGRSCDRELERLLYAALQAHRGFTSVLNGRFKGGHITRHFGDPAHGIHAVQMEMAECVYMDERCPYAFDETRAATVRPVLRGQLQTALDWARSAVSRSTASGGGAL